MTDFACKSEGKPQKSDTCVIATKAGNSDKIGYVSKELFCEKKSITVTFRVFFSFRRGECSISVLLRSLSLCSFQIKCTIFENTLKVFI